MEKFEKGAAFCGAATIALATALTGCATTGTAPVVQRQAQSALDDAIIDRGYIPLPAPMTDYGVGRVFVRENDGGATSLPECDSSFDHILRDPPAEEPPRELLWGSVRQFTSASIGGSAGTGAPLPSGLSVALSGQFSKIAEYTLHLDNVTHRQLARPTDLLGQTKATPKCREFVEIAAATPSSSDASKTLKDALYVVTETVEAEISYTFQLNPQAIPQDGGAPAAGPQSALDANCGVHAKTDLGGVLADISESNIGFEVSNCKAGSFTLKSKKPMFIAHKTASLASWDVIKGQLSKDEDRVQLTALNLAETPTEFDSLVPAAARGAACKLRQAIDPDVKCEPAPPPKRPTGGPQPKGQ